MKTYVFAICDSEGMFDQLLTLSEHDVIKIGKKYNGDGTRKLNYYEGGVEFETYYLEYTEVNLTFTS